MLNRVLPVEARPASIAFPDEYAAWTSEHHNAIWGGDVRAMLLDLLEDASRDIAFMSRLATPTPNPAQHPITRRASALEKAHINVE